MIRLSPFWKLSCLHGLHSPSSPSPQGSLLLLLRRRHRDVNPRPVTKKKKRNPESDLTFSFIGPVFLTARCLDLLLGALCTLLALDALGLAAGSTSGGLGLLSLLLGLGCGLLLLGVLDGGLSCGGADFGALRALLLDHVEGGTDDGTLVLDGTAGALLGDFLCEREDG